MKSVFVVCLTIAVVYLLFPTKVYYWDGIAFAQAIEDAGGFSFSLVHPNHLIYNFAGYGFYWLLHAAGFEIRAVTALQVLNNLLSAACAGLIFAILKNSLSPASILNSSAIRTIQEGGKRSATPLYLSLCLTLLFAFSATWWKFSIDANAYIPSVLFLLVSFYLVLPDRRARPVLLGLTFFASMCFHQLAIVAYPVLALGVYSQEGSISLKRRALHGLVFTSVAFVCIVGTYSFFFYKASGVFDVARLLKWTASYSPDAETTFNLWSNLSYSLRGHVRLFFGGRFNSLEGLINPVIGVFIVCLVVAVLLLIVQIFRSIRVSRRPFEPRQKTLLLLALTWTTVYAAFLFVWLPQNTFYRLFYLPALVLLLGFVLYSFQPTVRGYRTALFVAAVALANFLFLIYPYSHVEKYPPLALALQMNREWPAGTVIYYGLKDSDQNLVRYFNPTTSWKQLSSANLDGELSEIYKRGAAAWLETTAIDQLRSTSEGARWLDAHSVKAREIDDSRYRIRFVQVVPAP